MSKAHDIMTLSLEEFGKSYDADKPHKINRYMGGNRRTNHPYISGYWYLIMDPPEDIFLADGVLQAREWFHSTAESFTPPSKTITKVDVPGMGGMASSYAAGQEINREFTVAFREYQQLPISTAIRTWASMIDPHLGRSPLKDYIPANYKGQCFAILCRPTLNRDHKNLDTQDIEQVYYMEGVFPTTIPDDAFATDIADNVLAQLSVTFSFDGGFHTKESNGVVQEAIIRLRDLDDKDKMNDDSYAIALDGMVGETIPGTSIGTFAAGPEGKGNVGHSYIGPRKGVASASGNP